MLKHYKCLWPKRSESQRLCVVNIQWTPKDSQAHLKINSYCDDVFRRLVSHLGVDVQPYAVHADPLFAICTHLRANELNSTNKWVLSPSQTTKPTTNGTETRSSRRSSVEGGLNRSTGSSSSLAASTSTITTNGHGDTSGTNSWLSQSFKGKIKPKNNGHKKKQDDVANRTK